MRDVCPSAASQLIRSSSSAIAHTLMPRWRAPAPRASGEPPRGRPCGPSRQSTAASSGPRGWCSRRGAGLESTCARVADHWFLRG